MPFLLSGRSYIGQKPPVKMLHFATKQQRCHNVSKSLDREVRKTSPDGDSGFKATLGSRHRYPDRVGPLICR